MRTFLVDDHALLVGIMARWLRIIPSVEYAGHAENGADALKFLDSHPVDLLITDLRMPGMRGEELIATATSRMPELKVMVLSAYCTPFIVQQLSSLDIQAFLEKNCTMDEFAAVLESLAAGGRFYSAHYRQILGDIHGHRDSAFNILGKKEIAVLRALASGESDQEVAEHLHITEATVQSHSRNIRHKLGLHNRIDLMRYAWTWGLADPSPLQESAGKPEK
jgi:DNA-binding NarL/FixJ family response regulator